MGIKKEETNIYRKARIKASVSNAKFKSREGASEAIGVSKDSLLNYESGLCKQVPVDVVVKMAEVYNSPELMNNYCCNECLIGKLTVSPATPENFNDFCRLVIQLYLKFGECNGVRDRMLEIFKDGKVDETEVSEVRTHSHLFTGLSGILNDFSIATKHEFNL